MEMEDTNDISMEDDEIEEPKGLMARRTQWVLLQVF
jgi:hypothetical protein